MFPVFILKVSTRATLCKSQDIQMLKGTFELSGLNFLSIGLIAESWEPNQERCFLH